ncbi:uncharacterized protein Dana_GF16501 [Drosophila ananassae]|uniref:CCDC174 alpha/beta GRSR domain-containing protein n=1 Tax=Drosophila ananassae TaxID=7217 RepID=B3M2V2_DROAN|nr:coiled-coil domain-containing protein 174 [Drosophila ananassae]EDV43482.1 uncharacterized protein Dana_GF16501 [Drosophila ananassae]
MNDPNKKISVNLSSLLSLKAELLRKQHEVKLAKATKAAANEFRPSKRSSDKEKVKSKERDYKRIGSSEDGSKVYEAEDPAQLEKSRRVLEAKSKYYDRMSRSGGSLNSDDNCLVMFNRKKQEEDQEHQNQSYSPHRPPSSSSSEDEGADDDEVEYIDCLGRTRKCQRKDLAEAKRRDEELGRTMPQRLDQSKANWMIDTQGTKNDEDEEDEEPSYGPPPPESVCSDAISTMTKHDEQRMNWEVKEQENIEKPDVHYQDVFFDEARTHGVGYYAFSTDEAERRQQQAELEEARQKTAEEQKRRDELRAKRDSIVADRVLAAKNRIRAREGLPPISKEEYEQEQLLKKQEETAETDRERKEREKKEALDRKKAKQEAELDDLRKEHVRDWDRDKPGVAKRTESESSEEEWQYKAERLPMSQEEWNEKQRAQRKEEFAPMPEPKRTNFSSMPPPPAWVKGEEEFRNFHTSKQERSFQRRSYNANSEDNNDDGPSTSSRQMGAAIPPPASLNDTAMLPPAAKRPKSQLELERSIEAGLKFLRENCDKGALGNKATWTAKADY